MLARVMMALIVASLFALPQAAEARPDTRKMTCAQAQAFVNRQGAVVMTTGTHTFDRFVSSPRYCQVAERIQPERVQTSDQRRCLLQWRCVPDDRVFDNDPFDLFD